MVNYEIRNSIESMSAMDSNYVKWVCLDETGAVINESVHCFRVWGLTVPFAVELDIFTFSSLQDFLVIKSACIG
jgi:hypothetical protein